MSKAAHDRGTAVLRTATDRKIEAQFQRNYDLQITAMNRQAEQDERRIAELEAQVAELSGKLQHVTLYYDLRVAERDAARVELHDAEARIAVLIETLTATRRGWEGQIAKHNKLSEIVRLALTPEQYHQYRRIVENN